MAIYAGTALLVALINAALSLLGLALLAWIHGYTNPTLTTIAVGLFVVCLYVCVFPPPVRWGTQTRTPANALPCGPLLARTHTGSPAPSTGNGIVSGHILVAYRRVST